MKHHFSRSVNKNYSWLPKGWSSSIVNLNKKGSWSMIAALWWDGEFLIQIVKSTVNQSKFQKFFCILNFWLNSLMKSEKENIIVNLDNASIHTSALTRRLFWAFGIKVWFLPPYSPKLAPIEILFNIIKTKIRSFRNIKCIDFEKDSGVKWIFDSIKTIKRDQLIQIWLKVIKNSKAIIINWCF